MQTILIIIGLFTLGWLARRVIQNNAATIKWLNSYIINLAWPAIILLNIPSLEIQAEVLIPAGIAWSWALIGGLLVLVSGHIFNFSRPIIGATLLLAILGNTSFLGYPMALAYFGDEVLGYAIFYDQLGSFLILSTVGLVIIAVYAPEKTSNPSSRQSAKLSKPTVSVATILKRIFTFPPFIALMLSVSLPVDLWLAPIEPALSLLGLSLMPVALFVIGLQFQPQLLPEHRLPLILTIMAKMVFAPALAYIALTSISGLDSVPSIDNPILRATVFQAAMPCMITPGILAIQAGLSPRFCATLLGYSTLFSFIWLPLVARLI